MQQHFPDIEALAADPQFVVWVQAGRPVEQGSQWTEWQTTNPGQAHWVDEAADLIIALRFPAPEPGPTTINAEWERLLASQKKAPASVPAPVRYLSRTKWWLGVAASFLLLLAAGTGLFTYLNKGTYNTNYAEQKNIVLDDGTEIDLQANSTLRVIKWNKAIREVSLRGEAFFTVAHQPERPFSVAAGSLNVTVLGTRFNLVNRDSRNLVALEEGKVTVKCGAYEKIATLVPGQVAAVSANREKIDQFTPANLETYTSWRDGYWKLDRTSLGEIAHRITDSFGAEVVFSDPELQSRELSGSLPAAKLNSLLAALSGLLGSPVVLNEEGIIRF